ncbi:DNA polymerase eta [Trypanosoma theileri]|uniref:DNA polymerase eta n=1 Tax=Trypanosoma theileri TaxID=67003 RepID=A0A1X0NXK7_9TRYP|nr:DNA polymerase eta [Trypanosoma theileri]ORC89427.1 DNA polymerase eta [Trypanosoma theileri]
MRCIAHLDMDCFYAQVEAVRLGIDCRTEPYILSQWGNLIAVNYPARQCGIVRFNTVEEAKEKCPHVKVSHVATYAVGETEYKYHEKPQKGTHKVALEPYREASRHIFNILRSFEGVKLEKGSVDEAFLDVTVAAEQIKKSVMMLNTKPLSSLEDVMEPSTRVILNRQEEINAWFEERGKNFHELFDSSLHPLASMENILLLGAASRVVWNIRQRIREELHYDCSAGIAHNKLLAKSISSRHKPNQQTLLLPNCVASAMWDTSFRDIRGFGGKYGEAVQHACGGMELCREAWLVPKEVFKVLLGDANADYTYRRLRCYDEEKITKRSISKTLMASKVFNPPTSLAEGVKKWITVLSSELCARYKEFCDTYNAKGHTLNVKLGNRGLSHLSNVLNRTLALPELVTTETLINATMHCVISTLSEQYGVTVNAVTLTIGSFKEKVNDDGMRQRQQMVLTSFFAKKDAEKRDRSNSNEATVITISSSSSLSSLSSAECLEQQQISNKEVVDLEEEPNTEKEVIFID